MNTERWEYKIEGKQYGFLRMLIFAGIAVFFAVLAVDQLMPGDNKYLYAALIFAAPAVISGVTAVRLAIRYFCLRIYVGKNGFYCQTEPFDGKYYRYSEAKSANEDLKRYHRRGHGTSYAYYFNINFKNGKTKSIVFDRSLHEREFNELKKRINEQ